MGMTTKESNALAEAEALYAQVVRLFDEGRYAEATPLAERLLALLETTLGPEHPRVAMLLSYLAGLYWKRGAYERAVPLAECALRLYEAALGPEHPRVATSLDNLALLYREQGAYERGEPLAERALRIREKTLEPEHPDVAASLHSLARLYQAQGAYERAELFFKRALHIDERAFGAEHSHVAVLLTNLALLYQEQGEHAKAKPLLRRALRIIVKAFDSEHPHIAVSLSNLAQLYWVRGAYKGAELFFGRALCHLEAAFGSAHPHVAASLDNLAQLYREQGAWAKAEPLLRRALCILEKVVGPEHPYMARPLHSLAVLSWQRGDILRACSCFEQAATLQERNLNRTLAALPEARKRLFLQIFRWDTLGLVSFHAHGAPVDAGALALALTTTLRRKGRILDEVAQAQAALRRHLSPELRDELTAFRERRTELVARRLAPSDPHHADVLRALEDEVERREAHLIRTSAAFRAQVESVTLERVQAALPQDAVLVEFVRYHRFDPNSRGRWQGARYLAYIVRRVGPPQWLALGEAEPIEAAVAGAQQALARPGADARGPLRALDALVFEPVRRLLGPTDHWLLSPDGTLHLVPFAALVDEGGGHLVERMRITYLTSGRDLLRHAADGAPRARPLVLAAPEYHGRHHPLPGTQKEAYALQAHFPEAEVLVGPAAAKAALARASAPLFLHVASHGFVHTHRPRTPARALTLRSWEGDRPLTAFERRPPPPDDRPEPEDALDAAGLLLAGATDAEATLTAREVAALDLEGTQLVVLSACETGAGLVAAGEGVYGLRRALTIAGAEAQVVSLWKVHDAATAQLMGDYYRRLRRCEGRSEALRQAQLARLGEAGRAHPYYWAAFVPIGAERPLRLPPAGVVGVKRAESVSPEVIGAIPKATEGA